MSSPKHNEIVSFVRNSINGDINSISIIGSYLIDNKIRKGSDLDLLVTVRKLETTTVCFNDVFQKNVEIKDSMGKRREINTKFDGITLDITIIDSFNKPNNPLTDSYENAIGTCLAAMLIYGRPLREIFSINNVIEGYEKIRDERLNIVNKKIEITKQKIQEQGRNDLHNLYELEKYVFIRECIFKKVFNYLSVKHAELSIPDFNEIYRQDLKSCNILIKVEKILT